MNLFKITYLNLLFLLCQPLFAQENVDKMSILSLEELALKYRENNDFENSEKTFLKILNLKEKSIGINNESYSNTVLNFALLKEKENNLPKMDSLLKVSISINDKINADNSKALYLQAKFYTKIRLYDLAELNYLRILLKADKSIDLYLRSMLELFSIYTSTGEFSKAEKVLLKIEKEDIRDINLKLLLLDEIAIFYRKQKNFEKYSKAVYEASEIRFNEYDKDNPEICKSLNNLAFVAIDLSNYEKAKELILTAFTIHSKKFGLQNELSASYINNLGIVYNELENFEKSEFYFKKALVLRESIIGIYHEDFVSTVNNLSALYYSFDHFDKALELYDRYIDKINLKLYSQNDPNYLITLVNYGSIYKANNNLEKAKENFNKSLNLLNPQIRQGLEFMSADEFNSFKNEFLSSIEIIYSFLNDNSTQYPEINIGSYENELLVKNLSLRNQQRIKTSIEKSGNILLQEKYQQFIANKRHLTKLEELPIDKRPTNYEQLITTTETLEKELVRQSTAFADAKKSLTINWKQIQENLKPNEIAIDLVAYNYYNKKWTDSIVYAAFVVKKDSKFPKYVPLFEEKQLEFLLAKNKNEKDHNRIDKQYSDRAIRDLFLKPLEKEFNGCRTIYLSPSGLAHQINFKALPISENQTFGEQFNIKLVGSSVSIVDYKTTAFQENKNLEIILYGGIDYAKSSVTTPTNEENKVAVRSDIEGGFGYIKGTLAEINGIANQVKTNKHNAVLKTERNATEESIKQLDRKIEPFVLHLATHGYFFPDPKQELPKEDLLSDRKFKMYKTADDPMMRSGLLFAGANKYWGKPTENLTTDDGILTASEISNLDLSACQLVVMSACETGLGQINGSEGVFGLQRAFKMAGVKNIIMSLWKVPDAQTAELFDVFYSECFNGKSIQEAFQTAQDKMKIKYSPYYWAGFVLIE